MKINLLLHGGDTRSGYTNIGPFEDPNVCPWDLDGIADDAEVTDLLALDIIDYLPPTGVEDVLSAWIRKLRHGGMITVGGVDLHEVAHAFASRRIDLTLANTLLHGAQRAPWEYRKTNLTIQHVIKAFQDQGLKIEAKRLINYHYYVTARRS